jgi:hypothetical protein
MHMVKLGGVRARVGGRKELFGIFTRERSSKGLLFTLLFLLFLFLFLLLHVVRIAIRQIKAF